MFHVEQSPSFPPRKLIAISAQDRYIRSQPQLKNVFCSYGSGYHPVILAPNIFGPFRQNSRIHQVTNSFAQEHRLPLVRFDQSNFAIRSINSQRNPWEPATRTDIDYPQGTLWKALGQIKRFTIVVANSIRQARNSSQIDFLIPFQQKFIVIF